MVGMLGKHHSLESRKKMSATRKKLFADGVLSVWDIGKHLSFETCRKISESRRGKHLSFEIRQKIRDGNIGKRRTLETRQKISKSNKGKHPSLEACKNISVGVMRSWQDSSRRENHSENMRQRWQDPLYREKMIRMLTSPALHKKIGEALKGKKYAPCSKARRDAISKANKGKKRSLAFRKKISEYTKLRWQNPVSRKKICDSLVRRPTSLERDFLQFLKDNNITSIRYTGDFSFWISVPNNTIISYDFNGKRLFEGVAQMALNPDFIVVPFLKTKTVIELYGSYWHSEEEAIKRKVLYETLGYNCLIIWEHELYQQPDMVLKSIGFLIAPHLELKILR